MKVAYYLELQWYIAIPENLSNEDEILAHFEERFIRFIEETGLTVLQVKNGWLSAYARNFPGEDTLNNWLDQIHQEAMDRGMHLGAEHAWGDLQLVFENHSRDWLLPDNELKKWNH